MGLWCHMRGKSSGQMFLESFPSDSPCMGRRCAMQGASLEQMFLECFARALSLLEGPMPHAREVDRANVSGVLPERLSLHGAPMCHARRVARTNVGGVLREGTRLA